MISPFVFPSDTSFKNRIFKTRLAQRRKGAPKATDRSPSSYDFIRSRQQIRRHRQADLLGRFQIDHQLELHRLLDWNVCGLGAFEDLVDMHGNSPVYPFEIWSIGHQPSSFDRFLASKHAGELVLHRKLRDLHVMGVGYGIWKDEKSIGFLFDYCIESRANLRGVFYLIILKGGSQASGGALCLPQFALFTCMQRTR